MTAIGETLRRERLRRNLDLLEISRELKISPRFLDAIECDQFNKLPGGVFAKSFVRQYARMMGLDEEEMAAEVQRILEPAPEPPPPAPAIPVGAAPYLRLPRMHAWETVGDGRRLRWSSPLASLALMVGAILICSGIYAWWQARRSTVAPARATVALNKPAPVSQTPPVQTAAAAPARTAPIAPPPAVEPGPAGSADRRAPDFVTPAASTQPAAISPASLQRDAAAAGDPNAPVQVRLTAEEPVWVRVRSGGKYLFSGTLDANQTRTVDASGVVELLIGNAGGMQIALNGKPIGTIGPRGQVRTVQLSSGGFKIVPPRPSVPLDPL